MRVKFGARVQRTADHLRERNATLRLRRTARGCRLGRLRFQNVRHQVTHEILKNLSRTTLNRHFGEIHLLPENPTRAGKPRIQEDRGGTMEEFVCRSVKVNIDRFLDGSSTFSKNIHNRAPGHGWTRAGADRVAQVVSTRGTRVGAILHHPIVKVSPRVLRTRSLMLGHGPRRTDSRPPRSEEHGPPSRHGVRPLRDLLLALRFSRSTNHGHGPQEPSSTRSGRRLCRPSYVCHATADTEFGRYGICFSPSAFHDPRITIHESRTRPPGAEQDG